MEAARVCAAWLTVTLPTLIPGPNETLVPLGVQLVPEPVRVTDMFCPWTPVAGEIWEMRAELELTVNPLVACANSPPVTNVTVRGPTGARQSMVTMARAVVLVVGVTELTVMPSPKLATGVPFRKWVLVPTTSIGRLEAHWAATLGEMEEKDRAWVELTANPPTWKGEPAGQADVKVPEGIAQTV